jgi:hypothetical protein
MIFHRHFFPVGSRKKLKKKEGFYFSRDGRKAIEMSSRREKDIIFRVSISSDDN